MTASSKNSRAVNSLSKPMRVINRSCVNYKLAANKAEQGFIITAAVC